MDLGLPATKLHSAKIFLLAAVTALIGFAAGSQRAEAQTSVKNPQVEYITPDGQFSALSATHSVAHKPSAEFVDSDTISCVLREGETTFIIKLPKNSTAD